MTTEKQKPMLGFAGQYQFIKHKADADGNIIEGTSEVVLPWFDNLITDYGLNALGNLAQDNLRWCRLGTGSTAPANSDTQLGGHIAAVDSGSSGGGGTHGYGSSGNEYIYRRVTYRFPAASASGVNLAEVGTAATATGTNIFSRSLLKDTGGTPTTITLAADEVLDVVYELRMYPSLSTVTTTNTIDGVSTTVNVAINAWRAVHNDNNDPWNQRMNQLGGIIPCTTTSTGNTYSSFAVYENAPPSLAAQSLTTFAWDTYVANSFQRAVELNIGLVTGNFATGIGGMVFNSAGGYYSHAEYPSGLGQWALTFSPKIQKDATKTAKIKVGISWGRYTP